MKIQKDPILDFEIEALRLKLHRAYNAEDYETVRLISAIFDGITLERIEAFNGKNATQSYPNIEVKRR